VVGSQSLPDYYAVLQVHPNADAEVIEAAYRQLMKKHHPDVAGDDPVRAAANHARSKTINEAFRVLRDPEQRRRYDAQRFGRVEYATSRPPYAGAAPAAEPAAEPRPRPTPPPEPQPPTEPVEIVFDEEPRSPFRALIEAYYLLPGMYEWEDGRQKELLTVVLLPIVGVAGFSLATGRLTPFIGQSLNATVIAWAVVGLATLPFLPALPRIVLAAVPSLALVSGALAPMLADAHVPVWLAWTSFALLGLLMAARLYVFSVLPMLAVCWLLAR
jgi:hypothetical protein